MATKLRTMPTGATVPSAQAVIGAVASVAPTDEPSVRQPKLRPERGVGPAAEARGAPERRGGQPAAEIEDGPRIDQQHREAGGREQRLGSHLPLAHPASSEEQRERRGPGRRRGPAEEADVGGCSRRRDDQRRARGARRSSRASRKTHAADQPDVEPRDREQVHQPGLGEPILQVGIDAASAAEHQRVDQRRAAAVELAARAERGSVRSRAPGLGRPAALSAPRTTRIPSGAPAAPGPRDPGRLDATRRARPSTAVPGGPAGGDLAACTGPPSGATWTRPPSASTGSARRTAQPDASRRTAARRSRPVGQPAPARRWPGRALAPAARRSGERPPAQQRPRPGPPSAPSGPPKRKRPVARPAP